MSPTHQYHHGDLRNALLREGTRLLMRHGPDAVSLREIARRAHVSPRAPYRHFPDRSSLLAALAERGFEQFGAALLGALRPTTPERRLHALAGAYIAFVLENPRLVQLMFGDSFPQRAKRHPALHRAALQTFGVLQLEVARLRPNRSRRDISLAATAAWALVHGLSDLLRKSQLEHVLPDARARAQVQRFVVQLLINGTRD